MQNSYLNDIKKPLHYFTLGLFATITMWKWIALTNLFLISFVKSHGEGTIFFSVVCVCQLLIYISINKRRRPSVRVCVWGRDLVCPRKTTLNFCLCLYTS